MADWTSAFPIDWSADAPSFPDLSPEVTVWDGIVEREARMAVWDGTAEHTVAAVESAP